MLPRFAEADDAAPDMDAGKTGLVELKEVSLVRSRRLELPRGFPHKHLKLARLPFRHDRAGKGRGIADE